MHEDLTGREKDLSFDDFDEERIPGPPACAFEEMLDRRVSRRGFVQDGFSFGVGAFVLGAAAGALPAVSGAAGRLAFKGVPANTLNTVTVPDGYTWHGVVSWGDPILPGAQEFDPGTRGTAASQEGAFGDNTDGMALFTDSEGRHLLAINNEYTNARVIWPGGEPEGGDDVRKGMAAHGVSVVQIEEENGRWKVVAGSPFNRRITPMTEMEITGPARGSALLKTAGDPSGTSSLGTWNNCGNGRTPWGTYLTCEENFNGYFSSSDEGLELTDEQRRYGLGHKDWGYGWAGVEERFDLSKHPNEPNRAGYVVEIDPHDPGSTPKKRTALGRFKHENAELVLSPGGKVVVYMGDDERGEYLYRFVSSGHFAQGGDNRDLLEDGTLYVARFDEDGRGQWLPLTPGTTGMGAEEIAVFTRMGASKVKGTTMDRPEWVAANPAKAEVYCCLTNNKNRGVKPNAGGDPTPVNGPNPREKNLFGQVVRWRPDGGDHVSDGFDWDLFVLAGNPEVHSDAKGGSDNVTADNMFNSPDGLAFDPGGLLWIQTDGDDSDEGDFAGMGNNQMLCADTQTGEIRRFLVGPSGCEVTGFAHSPDRRTIFVGIQHPGGEFPDGRTPPRATIVAVKREDGERIV